MHCWTGVWGELPGPRQFLDDLVASLRKRKSVIVLVPDDTAPDSLAALWHALRFQLEAQGLEAREVYLPEQDVAAAPGSLADSLQLEAASPRTVSTVVECPGQPDVITLMGLEEVNREADRADWGAFVERWAAAAHAFESRQEGERWGRSSTAALCLIAPARFLLTPAPPSSDRLLTIRWLWSVPGMLDLRLYCRLRGRTVASDNACTVRWREHLLPPLAEGDSTLAETLWDALAQPFEGIVAALERDAARRDWSAGRLREWGVDALLDGSADVSGPGGGLASPRAEPPPRLRLLWQKGVVRSLSPSRVELHSAALAALNQRGHLRHRLWRGQVSLLFPLLDEIRLAACARVTRRHGPGWPTRWHAPVAEYQHYDLAIDATECELRHLLDLMETDPARFSEVRPWQSLLWRAHETRNALAHYKLVDYATYESLAHDYARQLRR